MIENYPICVPQYSFSWLSYENIKPTSLAECIFVYIVDVLLFYNNDMDLFFGENFPFLQPYATKYEDGKSQLYKSDPNYKQNLEEFKADFRDKILSVIEKSIPDIEEEHIKLSQSFGIPLGVVSDFKYDSILDYCQNNRKLLKSNEFPPSEYVSSNFMPNFLVYLTVVLLYTFSLEMIPLYYKQLDFLH